MIGFMLTSLKVVNIAVSFLAETRRLATVLRKLDIFSRLGSREALFPKPDTVDDFLDTPFFTKASSTSILVILPFEPVPVISEGLIPYSWISSLAKGDASTSISETTGVAATGSFLGLGASAGLSLLVSEAGLVSDF